MSEPYPLLDALVGQQVVIDFEATYVCLGLLASIDPHFLELTDADLHDFRDSQTSREIYVYDSARLGIRRNRARVLVRRDQIVAISRLEDVAES